MNSSGRPDCPRPGSVGVVAAAYVVRVPTRLPIAHVAPSRVSDCLVGQPEPARVLSSARGAGPRSARWSRLWRVPGRWRAETGSAVWPCRRGCTHAADHAACPQVARTDLTAGWPGTGQLHLDTTRECLHFPRRGRRVRCAPFFLGLRIDHGHHARFALALRRPRRTPRACALVRTAGILQHAPDGARA